MPERQAPPSPQSQKRCVAALASPVVFSPKATPRTTPHTPGVPTSLVWPGVGASRLASAPSTQTVAVHVACRLGMPDRLRVGGSTGRPLTAVAGEQRQRCAMESTADGGPPRTPRGGTSRVPPWRGIEVVCRRASSTGPRADRAFLDAGMRFRRQISTNSSRDSARKYDLESSKLCGSSLARGSLELNGARARSTSVEWYDMASDDQATCIGDRLRTVRRLQIAGRSQNEQSKQRTRSETPRGRRQRGQLPISPQKTQHQDDIRTSYASRTPPLSFRALAAADMAITGGTPWVAGSRRASGPSMWFDMASGEDPTEERWAREVDLWITLLESPKPAMTAAASLSASAPQQGPAPAVAAAAAAGAGAAAAVQASHTLHRSGAGGALATQELAAGRASCGGGVVGASEVTRLSNVAEGRAVVEGTDHDRCRLLSSVVRGATVAPAAAQPSRQRRHSKGGGESDATATHGGQVRGVKKAFDGGSCDTQTNIIWRGSVERDRHSEAMYCSGGPRAADAGAAGITRAVATARGTGDDRGSLYADSCDKVSTDVGSDRGCDSDETDITASRFPRSGQEGRQADGDPVACGGGKAVGRDVRPNVDADAKVDDISCNAEGNTFSGAPSGSNPSDVDPSPRFTSSAVPARAQPAASLRAGSGATVIVAQTPASFARASVEQTRHTFPPCGHGSTRLS